MKKREILIAALIMLTGIFHFKGGFPARFFSAQFGLFIFSVGVLGSCLLYEKNKWIGYLGVLFAIGFLKTYLCQHTPEKFLFEEMLGGVFIFGLYYIIRELKLKEDILKWFLVPVGLNIVLVFIQAFDHNLLSFMPVGGVTGFIGNRGLTACFLGLSTPIFLKYFKKGLPFLILAILLCKGIVGFLMCVMGIMLYYYYNNRNIFKFISIVFIISILSISVVSVFKKTIPFKEEVKFRLSMLVGSVDGAMHNPILGWGIGSFKPTIAKVPPDESIYLGVPYNQQETSHHFSEYERRPKIMNHPHNELVYGWWNAGLLFPILILLLFKDIGRKFTVSNLMPFSILVAGFICMMGYFFSYPMWFFLVLTLGVYDNQKEILCRELKGQKVRKKVSRR